MSILLKLSFAWPMISLHLFPPWGANPIPIQLILPQRLTVHRCTVVEEKNFVLMKWGHFISNRRWVSPVSCRILFDADSPSVSFVAFSSMYYGLFTVVNFRKNSSHDCICGQLGVTAAPIFAKVLPSTQVIILSHWAVCYVYGLKSLHPINLWSANTISSYHISCYGCLNS